MYIFLTQCFPSSLGGIESLIGNLALSLGKNNKVIVFADRSHIFYDAIYDNKYKNEIIVKRFSGFKFFRRRKKVKDLKVFIESNNVSLVISDTWKSLELCIDYLNTKNISVICLAHGNELIANNKNKEHRIQTTLQKIPKIIANSTFTANLVKKIIKNINQINIIHPGASDLRSVASDNFMKISGYPVLLTLARLEKRKGHKLILEALCQLKEIFPKIKYIIAGEGIEKNNIKKLLKNII